MKALTGFAILLSAQAAGELVARVLKANWGWTLPGPVLGMLILCAALLLPWIQRHWADAVGDASQVLLAHLSLLFVPVGVGVVVHLGLLSTYGLKLVLVLLVSTWLGLAMTALVLRRRWPSDGHVEALPARLVSQSAHEAG